MAHYQTDVKFHLPKDEGFREENRNKHISIRADAPEKMFGAIIKEASAALGFGFTPEMLAGLFLNVINQWPDNLRGLIARGIIEGKGLTLILQNKQILAELNNKFNTLPIDGEKQTPSGLVIPNA